MIKHWIFWIFFFLYCAGLVQTVVPGLVPWYRFVPGFINNFWYKLKSVIYNFFCLFFWYKWEGVTRTKVVVAFTKRGVLVKFFIYLFSFVEGYGVCFRDFSTLNPIFLPFGEQVRAYMIERRCQASSGGHFVLPNSYIHPRKLCSGQPQHLWKSTTPGPSPSSSWDPPPSWPSPFPLSKLNWEEQQD